MTAGTIKTKGTRLFVAPADSEILKVACPTGITGLGGTNSENVTTCLDSEAAEAEAGLFDGGTITVPINFIPKSASHQALEDLLDSGAKAAWLECLSDQTGTPNSLDTDGYIISPGATTRSFKGFVSGFTEDKQTAELVRATLTIRISGPIIRNRHNPIYA